MYRPFFCNTNEIPSKLYYHIGHLKSNYILQKEHLRAYTSAKAHHLDPGAVVTKGLLQILDLTFVFKHSQNKP